MNSNQVKTIEINTHGRVQGVFYRQTAVNFAKSLRLSGYIKAIKADTVRIVAQGPKSHLLEFLKWCQRGTTFSKVEGMSYKWIDTDKKYKGFKLKRSGSFLKDKAKSVFNLGKRIQHEVKEDLTKIKTPKHVVIIPDGNRRWAKENGIETWKAYEIVGKKIDRFVDYAKEMSIKHLTLWGFSTENWRRGNEMEIKELMKLFAKSLDKFKDKFLEDGVRFRHLGRKDRLPKKLIDKFKEVEEMTSGFKHRSLNIAIDYGGRDEILRAVDRIIQSGQKEVTEEVFDQFLDTSDLPDPDLIIRTSGEKRLSGLMPWQSVYSEFYFTNVYFPDFDKENFEEALREYSTRKRNFGGDRTRKTRKSTSANVKKFELNKF
ncbi:di-trans,poly-cis-decaprenylcistransferase [Candidatus Dojkabacteria bacterium]|nr:di-trans,poly-cis-decaprenylcistransferase [Candidatus Dojkabacteria bacterium]